MMTKKKSTKTLRGRQQVDGTRGEKEWREAEMGKGVSSAW